MPSKSKAQQRFMGMVHATQKGKKPSSPEVSKVAKKIDYGDAEDFAKTKHTGLPNKVRREQFLRLELAVRKTIRQKLIGTTGRL